MQFQTYLHDKSLNLKAVKMSLLNQQNICVFCNRSNNHASTTDILGDIKLFVKLLERFIGNGHLGTVIKVEELFVNELEQLLNICEGCSLIVNEFRKSYHELKCLELQLEWKLRKIVEIIKLGSRVPSRGVNLNKLLKETFPTDGSKLSKSRNLLKTFRRNIIRNGQRRLKHSLPRVLLRRKLDNNISRISAHADLLKEDNQTSTQNCDSDGTKSLNIGKTKSHSICSDPNILFEESTQDTFIGPKDPHPEINDATGQDQTLNEGFDSAAEEEEGFASVNLENLGESVMIKSEQHVLVHEIPDTTPQQEISPPPPSLVIESSNCTSLSFGSTNSRTNTDASKIDCEKAKIPSTFPETDIQITASIEITLASTETPHQDENINEDSGKNAIPLSSQPYNLRIKQIKAKLPTSEETSSDNDVHGDEYYSDVSDLNYSSETTSESEENDEDDNDTLIQRQLTEQVDKSVMPKTDGIEHETRNNSGGIDEQSKTSPRKRKRRRKRSFVPRDRKHKADFKCIIDGCRAYFQNEHKYQEHKKLHDPGQFKCQFCDVVETNLIKLSFHEYRNHSKVKDEIKSFRQHNWTCPRCMRKSNGFPMFQAHFAKDHFNKYVDPSSDSAFQVYRCYTGSCTRTFNSERTYQNHKKLHEVGEFQCKFCDRKKLNLLTLSVHEYKSHTPEETQKDDAKGSKFRHACTCPRCFQQFDTKADYQTHFSFVYYGIGDDPKNLSVTTKFRYKPETQTMEKPVIVNDNHDSSKPDEKFKCYFCESDFDHAPDLAIHETQHVTAVFKDHTGRKQQNSDRMKFQCPRCPYKYNKQTIYLKHHLASHLNALPNACTICSGGKIFIPNSKHHFDRFHNKNRLDDPTKIIKCDMCPAYFLQPIQLLRHKNKIHQQSTCKCQFCGKMYDRREKLRQHLQNTHRQSKEDPNLPFGCDMENCKIRFHTLGELDIHKRYHNAGGKRKQGDNYCLTCEECGKECKSKHALYIHKYIIHSEKNFVCQECGKCFKRKTILNKHMLYHQNPDQWEFQCKECGKKCVDKHKLEEHERTHTKEKPFVCQFCGEKYAHRHNWRNHLKTKHCDEEEAQEDIHGIRNYSKDASFMSRKGSKKGDCIIAGKSTKI